MASVIESITNMALPPFLQQATANASASASSNASSPFQRAAGTGPFPPGLMDSFLVTAGQASPLMQLVLFFYRMIGSQLGLDPSVLLTMMGFLWGLSKIASQVYAYIAKFVDSYFMCAMYVSEHDHIYTQLMKWLAGQSSITDNQYLTAQTVWKSAWEEEEEELQNALFWTDGGDGDGDTEGESRKYLNFSNQAARSSPRYIPAMGASSFWHKGTYFRVYRKRESFMNTSGWGAMKDLEELRISCFGRSIEPIKRLLADAKTNYYHDTLQKTTIYRPKNKEMRRDNSMWQQVARRPVRPMRTVVLDSKEKHAILGDINEYLHPSTPKWYASRGIPLRRGYLFHGPPGTGKTSFSFALAGVFGIDIYVISLQDINVTEEDLAQLFTRLPRRCIVLLEDIDTAGLRRDSNSDDALEDDKEEGKDGEADDKESKAVDKKEKNGTKDKKKTKKQKKSKDADSGSDGSSDGESDDEKDKKSRKKKRSGKRRGDGNKLMSPESISLSGLLNAIDGVASHEGRILIMTTNKPESLDEALIRPGRVDVQVSFQNASSEQAGELFYRMYESSRARPAGKLNSQTNGAVSNRSATGSANGHANGYANKQESVAKAKAESALALTSDKHATIDISQAELRRISQEFGRLIPEGVLSPAEVQGFLLKRKKSPRTALDEASAWIEASRKQKESSSKVATVQ